jgi:hypothetical protein
MKNINIEKALSLEESAGLLSNLTEPFTVVDNDGNKIEDLTKLTFELAEINIKRERILKLFKSR